MQYELIPKYLGQMHHYTSFLYKLHLPKGSIVRLIGCAVGERKPLRLCLLARVLIYSHLIRY